MVRPALRLRLVPLARIPGAPPLPDLLWLIKGFGGAQIAAEAKGQDHVLGPRELLGIYARIRGEIGEGRHAGAPEGYDGALGRDTSDRGGPSRYCLRFTDGFGYTVPHSNRGYTFPS